MQHVQTTGVDVTTDTNVNNDSYEIRKAMDVNRSELASIPNRTLKERFHIFVHYFKWKDRFCIFGASYDHISFLDSLFLSSSSVCITGLYTVPFQYINITSQVFILLLTIVGGLPITTLPLQICKMVKHYKSWKVRKRNKGNPETASETYNCLDEIAFKSMLLILVVVVMTTFFTIISFLIAVGIYLQANYNNKSQLNGLSPWWFSLFLSIAGYNNVGYSFYSGPFTIDVYMNIAIILIVSIGNCYFPFIIWAEIKLIRRFCLLIPKLRKEFVDVCDFALANHHHLSIHLFPALQTRLFVFVNAFILVVGTCVTLGLEFNNQVLSKYNGGQRFMIMLFQAVNTRSSGFGTVDYTKFSDATLIVYIIMMIIKPQSWCNLEEGVYNIQNINDKEDSKITRKLLSMIPRFPSSQRFSETDLPIFKPPPGSNSTFNNTSESIKRNNLKSHWRKTISAFRLFSRKVILNTIHLLSKNYVWIILIVFIITASENYLLVSDPIYFNGTRIVFEVISAYGNVGLTMGYPNKDPSLSGYFGTLSKLCIIATMIYGRHRGFYGSMKDQEKILKDGLQNNDINKI
ncbi:low-affinity potassium transport protein [Acrasis kona]|uniref:Low-affinity potassium transport protein n=1 Tax=Acrasis kona TaxID=1008807 RepID=A0AAW2ZLC7_9EUKA